MCFHSRGVGFLQVALVNLQDVVNAGLPPLPPQAIRFAMKLTGLEPAHMYGTLKSLLVLAGKVGGFEIDSIARTTVLDAFYDV